MIIVAKLYKKVLHWKIQSKNLGSLFTNWGTEEEEALGRQPSSSKSSLSGLILKTLVLCCCRDCQSEHCPCTAGKKESLIQLFWFSFCNILLYLALKHSIHYPSGAVHILWRREGGWANPEDCSNCHWHRSLMFDA